MTSRRKSRRLEVLQEVHGDVRRSPRLRERYSRERSEDPSALATLTYVATSRPGLSGYIRQRELEQRPDSILNESGQSVPSNFDLGQDDTSSTHSGCTGEMGYVSAATAQHYTGDGTDPRHLYGLDGSEGEEEEDGLECGRSYHVVDKTRVTVTPPATPPTTTGAVVGGGSVLGWVVGGLLGLLFRLGSLLYLAATAILCLDVIIVHRCYMVFTAMTCWSNRAAAKPWLRFWILPVVLCALVALLLGGGLVPVGDETPRYNITDADLAHLHSDLTASIRSTLSKDIRQHVEKHVDEVVKVWMEERIKTEGEHTHEALAGLKASISLKMTTLQGEVEALLERRLAEVANQTAESSDATKALMMETMSSRIELHLETAKQQWMALINEKLEQDMSAVTGSVSQLRAEIQEREKDYSEQFSSLKKLIEDYNSTTTEALLKLLSDLQTTAARVDTLTSGTESRAHQLASLETEFGRVSAALEDVRSSIERRLQELEKAQGAVLSEEDVARLFGEEMSKHVEDRDSVLWVWLSGELKKVVEDREIPASGLTKKDANELIKIALLKYSADKIAKFDFALENSGGSVVQFSKTYPPALDTYSVMGVPLWSVPSSPKAVIQPGVLPGDCWAMDGVSGYILIKLKESVVVTGVTVEHIPRELTPTGSLSSAPRDFKVLGKNDGEEESEGELLGEFTYSTDGAPIQEFTVKDVNKTYSHVKFQFLANNGNEFYTCVYRVRVHGHTSDTAS